MSQSGRCDNAARLTHAADGGGFRRTGARDDPQACHDGFDASAGRRQEKLSRPKVSDNKEDATKVRLLAGEGILKWQEPSASTSTPCSGSRPRFWHCRWCDVDDRCDGAAAFCGPHRCAPSQRRPSRVPIVLSAVRCPLRHQNAANHPNDAFSDAMRPRSRIVASQWSPSPLRPLQTCQLITRYGVVNSLVG